MATVKPGGCVQLPTSERARFEAWAEDSYHLQRMGDVYRSAITTDAWRAWQAALAARQPVGEPVGYIEHFAAQLSRMEMTLHGLQLGIGKHAVYAAQPAQVYLDGLDRALGETIDQRDRYHEVADELADQIARITGVDLGEHSSSNCPWQNAIEAAEEYKPAQAVDLGQIIEQIAQQWDGCSYDAVGETIDVGRAIRAAGKRLIDSEAVGNG
ncbi:hypothetical protein ORG27_14740 [Stenotrophomonas lactitubi]|uniref:hypothetical protein n=1 Tax=Stenotrophomonas lactitubi TaxID=2045214 RepID=UPI00224941D9|nr:hypothetical protein [Stenotrophomonas lactitubi]MCX2894834.1 hypothetical protein [Stenotrophomonas lactitubi]